MEGLYYFWKKMERIYIIEVMWGHYCSYLQNLEGKKETKNVAKVDYLKNLKIK